MIRIVISQSPEQAKKYYASLQQSDYYTNDQELPGQFRGKLAERLGIGGVVTREHFYSLCDNKNPVTGEPLTARTNEKRRVGFDINFHGIKEASILDSFSSDGHIQEAFMASVREVMNEIESDVMTRVRVGKLDHDRKASGLIWGEFYHKTARSANGALPDPHIHCHCYVINATHDPIERKIKAAQLTEIYNKMPLYQAKFQKLFSDRLSDLGYSIRKTDKAFTIEGVPKGVVALFSKRTDQIGRFIKENGITDEKTLDQVGARTRGKKMKGLSMEELKVEWRKQIKENVQFKDGEEEFAIRNPKRKIQSIMTAKDAVDFAIDHAFERLSTMPERKLLAIAYKHSIGERSVSIEDINREFAKHPSIIRVDTKKGQVCTTVEVLKEEKHMVQLARSGKGKFEPLYATVPKIKAKDQQARAIEHVLTTKDQTSIVMGSAGSGKTTLMTECIKLLEKAGKKVTIVAPSAQASRGVLRKEGFEKADTVSKLLIDRKAQDKLQGQVLWCDEAGLLSTKEMASLLEVAKKQNARLILGGDTRQNHSILRGDALLVVNQIAGIKAAEVNKIHRQRDLFYRSAVQDLAKGNVTSAFHKLDEIGSIKEVDPFNPNEELVKDYSAALKQGKSVLIVSPTHKQGHSVTEKVREKLRESGAIGKKEIVVTRLNDAGLTEAERQDWRNLKEGQFVQFNQNVPKIKRGSLWDIEKIHKGVVYMNGEEGKKCILPLDRAKHFNVYNPSNIGISKGDKVRVTNNSFDQHGKRVDNGTSLEVASVNKEGKIVMVNPGSKGVYTFDKNFGHIDHDYCITSYASQGKTVDKVFIAQNSSIGDAKQFYVSVSRGRDSVAIYTNDKQELLKNVQESGDRQSAIELTSHLDHVVSQDRLTIKPSVTFDKEKEKTLKQPSIRKEEYEPEL